MAEATVNVDVDQFRTRGGHRGEISD
jgi:hypothetical protein